MKVGDLVKQMKSLHQIYHALPGLRGRHRVRCSSFALAVQETEPPAQWAEDYIHDGWWEVLVDGEFDVWPEHSVEVISKSQ